MFRSAGKPFLCWTGLFAILALGIAGCEQGPYLSGYTYQPHPGIYEVLHRGTEQLQQAPPLTVMVTINGIQRADPDHHVGPAVVMVLRIEDNGPAQATFDVQSLELVTGSLRPFPPPMVTPPAPIELSAGQHAQVTAIFPFPPNVSPEQMDLNELRLRWMVHVAGYPVPQTALFERAPAGYDSAGYEAAPPANSDVAY